MALRDVLARGFRRKVPPFRPGHRVEVLIDGAAFFPCIIESIEAAQHYVFLETYILASDKTGWRVANALAERARAGVEVALIYDGYGSIALEDMPDFLRNAGVKVHAFRKVSLTKRSWPWSQRNHRKLLVADGKVGIVGGMNIASEYDAIENGGSGWRDTAVRVEGPAVQNLELMFRRLWKREKASPALTSQSLEPPSFPEGEDVRFLGNFARRDRKFVRRAYLLAILGAQKSVRIMNAYFIPDRVIRRALIRAARRGVVVEVIVGGSTDVKAALYATRSFYSMFLKAGVRIYEWREKVLHAKTAVIDGDWSTIGSTNLDYLSSFRNLEVNAGIAGPRIGKQMEAKFESDRERSTPIDLALWRARPFSWRLFEWFFRLIGRNY